MLIRAALKMYPTPGDIYIFFPDTKYPLQKYSIVMIYISVLSSEVVLSCGIK